MIKNITTALLLSALVPASFAGTMGVSSQSPTDAHPWSAIGSLGYTAYQNSYGDNGQTALGRFAIGKDLFNFGSGSARFNMLNNFNSNFGVEVGVQSGNRMPIAISEADMTTLGGLPIWTTVQPMLDALATLKLAPVANDTFFGIVKGGVAYRRWQMDRDTVNNLYQIAGEAQAGVGMSISQSATLSLLYQGVYGANPNFSVNSIALTGHVGNIPVQNGALLSLSMTL